MTWSIVFLVVASPFFGSFVGLVVDRLPDRRSIVKPRSSCDHCRTPLTVRDLVPMLGWLMTRGRCRHCAEPIDSLYPALELAALVVAIWAIATVPEWLTWPTALLGFALLTLAAIDFRHLILPDEITLPLIPSGLVVIWWLDTGPLWTYAAAASVGYAGMLGLRAAYQQLRKREGLGLGDAKLAAAAGAWVGLDGLASVILIGAAFGLAFHLIRTRLVDAAPGPEIPFGPWIAAGFWLTWLYGPLQFA
jgi:leader peptidase (prepilin peptidase)/N-methyltransferase